MSFSRRTFLLGAGSGLSLLVLAACTDAPVTPTPTFTPKPLGDVPKPSTFLRSNWKSDPYARGATSYLAVGALPQARETLREPVLDRVFLAGEAFSDSPGTVRGAVESGADAARSALAAANDTDRIAIVGAGAAGAEAARILRNAGTDVIMIEARDRIGGRIDSRTTAGGAAVELGAWRLVDGLDDDLAETLSRAGIDIVALAGASAFAPIAGDPLTEIPEDDAQRAAAAASLNQALETARQQQSDMSISDAIEQAGLTLDAGDTGSLLLQQLLAELAATTGADASDASSFFAPQVARETYSLPSGPLASAIEESLQEVDPFLSTVVVGVFYDEDGVSLRLGTGESLGVDRVIITVPLGVLQEQAIEFDPQLPLLYRTALEQLSVGDVETVVLEFEEPFWDTDAVVWLREDTEEPIGLWVNLLPVTGENVLLGITGGGAAAAISELDDSDLLEAAQRSLQPFASI